MKTVSMHGIDICNVKSALIWIYAANIDSWLFLSLIYLFYIFKPSKQLCSWNITKYFPEFVANNISKLFNDVFTYLGPHFISSEHFAFIEWESESVIVKLLNFEQHAPNNQSFRWSNDPMQQKRKKDICVVSPIKVDSTNLFNSQDNGQNRE